MALSKKNNKNQKKGHHSGCQSPYAFNPRASPLNPRLGLKSDFQLSSEFWVIVRFAMFTRAWRLEP